MNHYKELAVAIVESIGGLENIEQLNHCATRLRFNLRNDDLAHENKIKNIKGVVGCVNKGAQLQVIIGNDVDIVYQEIILQQNVSQTSIKSINEKKKTSLLNRVLDIASGVFIPIIPAFIAGGLLKAVIMLLVSASLLSETSQTYIILNFVGDSVFYYLPIIIGYSASLKFNCSPVMGMVLGAMLLHPTFSTLVTEGQPLSIFSIPVVLVSYSSSVFPIIIGIGIMSFLQKTIERFSPKSIKLIVAPLLTLVIMVPIMFCVIGPIGTFLGNYLATLFNFLNGKAPWLLPTLMGAFSPLMVMVGMHWSLIPVAMPIFIANGFETFYMPGAIVSNAAQSAASFAVALKSKNSELRQTAISAGISAMLGISEPALYGVTLRLKKPLLAAIIGGGIGGLFCGIFNVHAFAVGAPGMLSIVMFIGGNEVMYSFYMIIAGIIIAFVSTFILTLVFSFKDDDSTILKNNETIVEITSPIKGMIQPLEDMSGSIISSGVMGKGVMIEPLEGIVTSPINGIVISVYETKHALRLCSDIGTELFLHIGINTVALQGKYFETYVSEGEHIKKGDILMRFDMDKIRDENFDLSSAYTVCNSDEYKGIEMETNCQVDLSTAVFKIEI